ncbi:hypothetical protein PRIPAC_80448 [Pristionchus pacificus]|nr:hypothetical protein PRIPAC_80448 [Pristionchus pacificus]
MRVKLSASVFIYVGLWANGIVSILTSGDVPNAQEIVERQQLYWLSNYKDNYLMIFGESLRYRCEHHCYYSNSSPSCWIFSSIIATTCKNNENDLSVT